LPFGIIFVFFNDYLSQERGFSVPDATYMVLLFGVGCCLGGILGGYVGGIIGSWNASYLPIFMSVTTALGILPFVALLNMQFTNAHGFLSVSLSILAGLIPSLPSVNVRPCMLNVNPPETRGASLTAANVLISLGRGLGPSFVTLMGYFWGVSRQGAFNIALVLFWIISAIQLLLLARTLPKDQQAMEADLASYAKRALAEHEESNLDKDNRSSLIVSVEERRMSFDLQASQQTLAYVTEGMKEIGYAGNKFMPCNCLEGSSSEDGMSEEENDLLESPDNWLSSRKRCSPDKTHPTETTLLVV
jgi:sugar phosphate permease